MNHLNIQLNFIISLLFYIWSQILKDDDDLMSSILGIIGFAIMSYALGEWAALWV